MSSSNYSISENNEGDSFFTDEEGITSWDRPTTDPLPKGWVTNVTDEGQRYYYNPEHGSFWDRPKKNGTPRKLHLGKADVAAPPAPVLNERVAKYNKMKKMGIPEHAIRQKMTMNGVDPSLLFGGPSINVGARPKIVLPTGLALKKVNVTKKNNKKNTTSNAKANMSKSIAEAAVAQLGKLRKVNRGTNTKKKNNTTGFAKFQKELAERATKRNTLKTVNVFGRAKTKTSALSSNNNYNGNNSWNNNSE
jgi:hypothetical protein